MYQSPTAADTHIDTALIIIITASYKAMTSEVIIFSVASLQSARLS